MIRTQTRVLQLPRTVTAPTSSTQSFLFRPAARAHSISLGQKHGYIQAPQVVQVVQLAGPKEEEAEVTQEDEPVKGLRAWLGRVGLMHLKMPIEAWAQEQGAAFLEEVTTNAEELATALQLTGEQSLRFQARLRALPPPKFAAPAQAPKVRKKLPVAAAPCPCCNKEDRMLWNVTIASQHEGWGRKWNECAYACQLCRRHISRQLHVNACRDCKVMWHPDCEQALAKDQAAKQRVPARAAPAPKVKVRRNGPPPAAKVVAQVPQVRLLRTGTVPTPPAVVVAPGVPSVSLLDRHSSTPHTVEEMKNASFHVQKAYVPLQAWNFSNLKLKQKTPDTTAKVQSEALTPNEVLIEEVEPLPGGVDRRIILERQGKLRQSRSYGGYVDPELLRQRIPQPWELQHPMQKELQEDKEMRQEEYQATSKGTGPRGFHGLQESFMKMHGSDIKNSLDGVFEGPVKLEKAQVGREVQQRFLEAMQGGYPILPTFHGSNERNYRSILERGLLIPGRGNELRVANGSAHGLGIYTANVTNPRLSMGFCTAPKMLVCGVLDDATVAGRAATCGNFTVKAQSNVIKHVGDAVVVFDESRVVPLWQASAQSFRGHSWRPTPGGAAATPVAMLGSWAPPANPPAANPATTAATKPAAVPVAGYNPNMPQVVNGMLDAGKGKVYHARTRQVAFMPPVAEDNRDAILQKRIFEKKARELRMKSRRQEKSDRHLED